MVSEITWVLSVSSSEIKTSWFPRPNLELGSLNYCQERRPKQQGVLKEEGEMEQGVQLQRRADGS